MIELPPDVEVEVRTERLELWPLRAEHATEMLSVLADESLHEFTGGEPPQTVDALEERYRLLESRRSTDGNELWLNWVVREAPGGAAVGYVQATVAPARAELAWVIGSRWQGRGYVSEAAGAMAAWIRAHYPDVVLEAMIHPDHAASAGIARRIGFTPTDRVVDGEIVWHA